MCNAIAVQNTGIEVDPGSRLRGLESRRHGIVLAIIISGCFFDFTFIILSMFVGAFGHKLRRVHNTGNLSTQKVLFFPEEERIADDVFLKISR